MKIHKRDRKAIIHEACDIVETGVSQWSCFAIDRAGRRFDCTDSSSSYQAKQIKAEYAAFYEKDPTEPWGFDSLLWEERNTFEVGKELSKSARILAMLLFLEAAGDV